MSRLRNWRDRSNETGDLNLAPFMNMVVILIPLLLMSVVFLKVGVINVTSPPMAPTDSSTSSEESEDLDLTVAISNDGFEIATSEEAFGAINGCPNDGPTVCLADPDSDVDSKIDRARTAIENGERARADEVLNDLLAAYDFAALYSQLSDIKAKHPGETTVRLTASPDIPYKLLVRVMDASRFKLEKERYASNEEFWRATAKARKGFRRGQLFSQPILAVGK